MPASGPNKARRSVTAQIVSSCSAARSHKGGALRHREEARAYEGASEFHGEGGPISVEEVRYQNPLSRAFLAAAGRLGFRRSFDFNDWSTPQDGFGRFKVRDQEERLCF